MAKIISLFPPTEIKGAEIIDGSEFVPFWEWFVIQAAEFFQQLNKPKPPIKSIEQSLKAQLDTIHAGIFCDVFIDVNRKAVIIFRNEDVIKNMVFVEALVMRAPALSNWQFHAFIPPASDPIFRLTVGDYAFDSEQLQFYFRKDPQFLAHTIVVVIYPPYNNANGLAIVHALKKFLKHYIGERIVHTHIDGLFVRQDVSLTDKHLVTVRPLSQLSTQLLERQQRLNQFNAEPPPDAQHPDVYTLLQAASPAGHPIITSVNSILRNWPHKPSFPWVLQLNILYPIIDHTQLPDPNILLSILLIFDEVSAHLKTTVNCLRLGHIYGLGNSTLYIAAPSFQQLSTIIYQWIKQHPLSKMMDYEIMVDKYWESFPMMKESFY